MPQIVSLAVLLRVEEHDHGRDEVDHLSRRQQVQVGSGVSAAVSVDPLQSGFLRRGRKNFADGVVFSEGRRAKQLDGAADQVQTDDAIVRQKDGVLSTEIYVIN